MTEFNFSNPDLTAKAAALALAATAHHANSMKCVNDDIKKMEELLDKYKTEGFVYTAVWAFDEDGNEKSIGLIVWSATVRRICWVAHEGDPVFYSASSDHFIKDQFETWMMGDDYRFLADQSLRIRQRAWPNLESLIDKAIQELEGPKELDKAG